LRPGSDRRGDSWQIETMTNKPYDYRNCQSLFGYAAQVHARSGAICALCGFGKREVDFDSWRQLTVEHVIGESQGGYRPAIRAAIATRYPHLVSMAQADLIDAVDAANTVTACQFCNATTSRSRADSALSELIASGPDDPSALLAYLIPFFERVLAQKRSDVEWKLSAVRSAYERLVEPDLIKSRA
jgi:hypothetical protein